MKNAENLNYQTLILGIFEKIRERARQRIPEKDGGEIQIMVLPFTKEADNFFGGLGKFDRKQHLGPSGCIALPNDPVTYLFELPIRVDVVNNSKIISFTSRNSYTLHIAIKKRVEIQNQAEGKVFTHEDWAEIRITVSGGRSKHECLECIGDIDKTIGKFFSEFSRVNGYAENSLSVITISGR